MATRQPLPRAKHAAVGIGSKMAVWGGAGGSALVKNTTLEIFDLPSMIWEQPQVMHGSEMPDRLEGMAVTTDGETGYSFGDATCSNPYTYYNTLFQITPSQHLCQVLLPSSPSHTAPKETSHSGIVHFNDKLVLHGGWSGQWPSIALNVFDLRKSECEIWY